MILSNLIKINIGRGVKRFKVSEEGLSSKEKDIFRKLIKAAQLIAPLYLRQKNDKYPGANFYPHDATVREIKEAAEKDPFILDPYTFVERNSRGQLLAIPYHVKFKKELGRISKILEEAASLSDNQNFSLYLRSLSQTLLDGNYKKSEILWLTTEPFKFGFVIGPVERYLDKLFFTKCAYQSWVGILDEKKTKKAVRFKNMFLSGRRKILPGSEKVNILKLGVRIDDTAIFSGLISDFMFTGANLPNDVETMEKYGSNLTIFKTPLILKFKESHLPIFKAIFNKDFQKLYSEEDLYRGSLRCILLHEIAHSLIRYRDAEARLGDLFPVFDELFAYILGIKGCGTLLLKDAISQKELEAILIMYICRNFMFWLDFLKNSDVWHYASATAISYNFFLEEKAIKKGNEISWPDFARILICIENLSHLLEYHLALGNYKEAEKFVKKYGSFDVFKSFYPKLKKALK